MNTITPKQINISRRQQNSTNVHPRKDVSFKGAPVSVINHADDLMEVFRPIVDLYVKIYLSTTTELDTKIKAELFNIINIDVLIDGQKQTISNAIELFVQSFQKSIKENKNYLKEIKIIGLEMHQYE